MSAISKSGASTFKRIGYPCWRIFTLPLVKNGQQASAGSIAAVMKTPDRVSRSFGGVNSCACSRRSHMCTEWPYCNAASLLALMLATTNMRRGIFFFFFFLSIFCCCFPFIWSAHPSPDLWIAGDHHLFHFHPSHPYTCLHPQLTPLFKCCYLNGIRNRIKTTKSASNPRVHSFWRA